METIKVAWFEKKPPIDEPLFKLGVRISLLQMMLVFISAFISYAIFSNTKSPLSLIALLLGLLVAFGRIKTLSFFTFLSLAIQYTVRKKKHQF